MSPFIVSLSLRSSFFIHLLIYHARQRESIILSLENIGKATTNTK